MSHTVLETIKDERGIPRSNIQAKHAVVNCWCHLANTNKRFRFLPDYLDLCSAGWHQMQEIPAAAVNQM